MRNKFVDLKVRLRKWKRKAFLWISRNALGQWDQAHYFWLANWNGRAYSWKRLRSALEIHGKPLDLRNWR